MKHALVLPRAVKALLSVKVFYNLGNKDLGEYYIDTIYPMTLLLRPVDGYRNNIWIPNPEALDQQLVVRKWDSDNYMIVMYEKLDVQASPVWSLTLPTKDLL
jgi:hypothetical protein